MFIQFKNTRILVALLHDVFWAAAAFIASICLRFDVIHPGLSPVKDWALLTMFTMVIHLACFQILGLYVGIWRFSSIEDLVRVIKSATIGVLLSMVAIFLYNRMVDIPRSMFVFNWLILIVGLGGGRFAYRYWKDKLTLRKYFSTSKTTRKNILIVGAGFAGERILREISNNLQLSRNVIGIIDDNKGRHHRSIHGVKVLGGAELIPTLVNDYAISEILIAIPSATSTQIKRIVNFCQDTGVQFKTLPGTTDILNGKIEFSLFRNIQLEDLLGRDAINLDMESIADMISDKTIMITGAGGSIGSELCRQIARFQPKRIILFEICEFFLYELEMNLIELFPNVQIVSVIGDVRNRTRVAQIMAHYLPNIVLHAAAYKHVPMMEKNSHEAIITNIFGTQIVAEEASRHGVQKFVMISTDKAINPTNIMGTTKRIAEMVCQSAQKNSKTQFIVVRFGNVLGSNGSVIPLFKKQIEKGGPITITHPEISRYFMSIPEACQLVLQAGTMGEGGEIFVLDMGEPIKIINLAREMLNLAGLKENEDIKIEYIGLRPGEKLYEELFSNMEKLLTTKHKKVSVALNRSLIEDFTNHLNELYSMLHNVNKDQIVQKLQSFVPEFTYQENKIQSSLDSLH